MAEPKKATNWLKTWAFALVPLVGLVELGAHVTQTRDATPTSDWLAARDAVRSAAKPEDLITFAPRWVDPVGREQFGGDLATVEREAYGDVSRFPRAFEVSIRGEHSADLSTWKKVEQKSFGAITLTTLQNPSYVPTKDDLVSHLVPDRVTVTHGDDDAACSWSVGNAQTGNLGFGPAIPGHRFECGGSRVGVSVVADMSYHPHRCIYAPPTNGPLRITFKDVAFGEVLHGNHGLYVEAERGRTGAPVTLTFSVGDKRLGRVEHRDGESWKGFELSTSELAGQTADLTAEITSSGPRRMYCFEAVTR